jgi:CheY-like chemotaxis protein
MPSALHILVVDDRPDSILFLTEFLLSRQHQVETCSNGSEALEAVMRRQRTNDSYDLVISDVSMPGMDGITLLQELRRRSINVPLVLYTGFGAMNPTLSQQAASLNCLAMLDKPLELRRIERIIEEVASRRSGTRSVSSSASGDQPFFGTSRVARPATSSYSNKDPSYGQGERAPGEPTQGEALERKSSPDGGPPPIIVPLIRPGRSPSSATFQLPSGPYNQGNIPTPLPQTNAFAPPTAFHTPPPIQSGAPSDPPRSQYPTTSVSRRSAAPPVKKSGYQRRPSSVLGPAQINAPNTTTQRIRRSISGSHLPAPTGPPPLPGGQDAPAPAGGPASRAVSCAHCRKIFLVLVKPEVYNAVCVHCGGLNRIDPL